MESGPFGDEYLYLSVTDRMRLHRERRRMQREKVGRVASLAAVSLTLLTTGFGMVLGKDIYDSSFDFSSDKLATVDALRHYGACHDELAASQRYQEFLADNTMSNRFQARFRAKADEYRDAAELAANANVSCIPQKGGQSKDLTPMFDVWRLEQQGSCAEERQSRMFQAEPTNYQTRHDNLIYGLQAALAAKYQIPCRK